MRQKKIYILFSYVKYYKIQMLNYKVLRLGEATYSATLCWVCPPACFVWLIYTWGWQTLVLVFVCSHCVLLATDVQAVHLYIKFDCVSSMTCFTAIHMNTTTLPGCAQHWHSASLAAPSLGMYWAASACSIKSCWGSGIEHHTSRGLSLFCVVSVVMHSAPHAPASVLWQPCCLPQCKVLTLPFGVMRLMKVLSCLEVQKSHHPLPAWRCPGAPHALPTQRVATEHNKHCIQIKQQIAQCILFPLPATTMFVALLIECWVVLVARQTPGQGWCGQPPGAEEGKKLWGSTSSVPICHGWGDRPAAVNTGCMPPCTPPGLSSPVPRLSVSVMHWKLNWNVSATLSFICNVVYSQHSVKVYHTES